METLLRDFRMAVRTLRRRPGVAALAVLSLGLAIGFCTVGFSLMDALQLRSLAVREPARLHWLVVRDREQRIAIDTWAEYQALARPAHSWEGALAECRMGPKVRLPDRDDFPITAGVSDNYFDLLGVKAASGDVFHAGGDRDGVVVVTDHYWQTALGGDLHIVGRSLIVGGASLRIMAVLPPAFSGTNRNLVVDLFVPPQTFFGSLGFKDHLDPHLADFEVSARLRPGVTAEQAQREEEAVLRRLEQAGMEPEPGRRAVVQPFEELSIGYAAKLMAPLVLVLLVAAANLANLRLVDNEARRRETGIRLALGAGRPDLLRQHASETLLLCGMGTALGLFVAGWLIDLVPAVLYAGDSFIDYRVRLDARTLAFTVAALLLVIAIGSLIPLSDAWKHRILPAIQTSIGGRPSRWMTALVVGQIAFVTAITCSAGLLWRSLQNISAIRPAMDPDRQVLLAPGFWGSKGDMVGRADALAAQFAGLPGVRRVAYARRVMLAGSGGGASVDLEMPGQPKTSFFYDQVSPGYFAATGARILMGHGFSSTDGPKGTPVVMVNDAFRRRYFPARNPLGQWIKINGKDRQILGVVEDGPTNDLQEDILPYFYFPFAQMPVNEATYFIESAGDAGALTASVRTLARRADANFTLFSTRTLRQHIFNSHKTQSVQTGVAGALALLGLLLASAGLFGVTSYAVTRRMREFGVRVALGASRTDLHRRVLRTVAVQTAIGIPLGWALAFAGHTVLDRVLYGVKAGNPWILAAASAVVALVAFAAALRPALIAARVDPAVTLRYE